MSRTGRVANWSFERLGAVGIHCQLQANASIVVADDAGELEVFAGFNDMAFLEHVYLIGMHNSRQAVSNEDGNMIAIF